MVEVVAALIWRDDRFMICRRPENKARSLLWEFVGGKVEIGESKEEALARECMEELDIEISAERVFCDVIHEYPDITVHLTAFESRIVSGEPKLIEHMDMRWITPEEIHDYDFCPADKDILEKIMERADGEIYGL